jgi:hypothetical protein
VALFGGHRRPTAPTLVLAGLLLVAGCLLLYAGRHLTFFYDEWAFILGRRGGGLHAYLDPITGIWYCYP